MSATDHTAAREATTTERVGPVADTSDLRGCSLRVRIDRRLEPILLLARFMAAGVAAKRVGLVADTPICERAA